MRESLRLAPTAPARTVTPIDDVVLGEKYSVKAGSFLTLQIWVMHRDPKVWGEDVGVNVNFCLDSFISRPRQTSSVQNVC